MSDVRVTCSCHHKAWNCPVHGRDIEPAPSIEELQRRVELCEEALSELILRFAPRMRRELSRKISRHLDEFVWAECIHPPQRQAFGSCNDTKCRACFRADGKPRTRKPLVRP